MKNTVTVTLFRMAIISLCIFMSVTIVGRCDNIQLILYNDVYKPCYRIGKSSKNATACFDTALSKPPKEKNELTQLIATICMLGCADAVSGNSMQRENQFCSSL
ncbi:MAG: hypothetical protein PF637_11185 [Spirochaetes bacterium]|jgi:hypothetical protein|nr:hypothetical protein [Spirochaetota bacterium]